MTTDPLERWRQQVEQQEREFAAGRAARNAQHAAHAQIDEDWLNQRLAAERGFVLDVVGAALRELLDDERSVTRNLQTEVRELRAQVAEQRARLAEQRAESARRGEVLPPVRARRS